MGRGDDRRPGCARPPLTGDEALSLLGRAGMYLDADSPRNAHGLLEFLLADDDPARDSALYFDLLFRLAESCQALCHPEHLEALAPRLFAFWERALGVAEAPDGPAPEWRAVGGGSDEGRPMVDGGIHAGAILARLLIHRAEYEEALRICREAWSRRCPGSPFRRSTLTLYSAEIQALVRIGDTERAEEVASRTLAEAQQCGDPALEGSGRALMANVLKTRGRFPEAQRLYNQAAALHRKGGDYAGVARDHLNRGDLLYRMGLLAESADSYRESRAQALRIGHSLLELRAALGVGLVAARSGDLPEARVELLGCWRRARRNRLPREECLALESLAGAWIHAGKLPHARRALRICRERAGRRAPCGDLAVKTELRLASLELAEGRP
jgi:tetratricopeptide (TPR) repeat protein